MKRLCFVLFLLISVVYNGIYGVTQPESLIYGAFGDVKVYRPKGIPTGLVLFVSGDGGWNKGVIDMTEDILTEGAFVVGINIQQYIRNLRKEHIQCYYPAGDFELLSLMIQKRYNFSQYYKPILVGYSSGATLVYGVLSQAPANTFKGAISLGFCPDIEIDKPLCEGSGLRQYVLKAGKSFYLEATDNLTAPFIVLLGLDDQICLFKDVERFMKQVKMGDLVSLPKVGHGFSVTKNWLPQFMDAYKRILKAPSYAEQKAEQNSLLKSEHLQPLSINMPITLIPTALRDTLPIALFISGDGGWTSFDQAIAENLAKKGIPVIGLDAQKYFWKFRSPDVVAADLTKVIRHYAQQWNRRKFTLMGYSFGASLVPFIAERFSQPEKNNMQCLFSLSPDETADFEIHITDMLSLGSKKDTYDVVSQIKKVEQLHPVCLFGDKENADVRRKFANTGVKMLTIPGNHHYNRNASAVADAIFAELRNLSYR